MQAQTADAKADCTEQAVLRIRSTLEWIKARDFMTPTQMHKWDHLVCPRHPLDRSRSLLVIVENTDIVCLVPHFPNCSFVLALNKSAWRLIFASSTSYCCAPEGLPHLASLQSGSLCASHSLSTLSTLSTLSQLTGCTMVSCCIPVQCVLCQ